MASSLSLLRKGLLMCLNLVDCIILTMSFSNSFNSSTGGGFLVDLKLTSSSTLAQSATLKIHTVGSWLI